MSLFGSGRTLWCCSWKRKITVASIESRLDSLGGAADDDFIRTFLLFTFGTFLFPNTNGTIDTRYLSFLSNLDYVHQYAWGSAVLEDLIMWLTRRKEKSMQYVGGCLLFLQIWFYEHIDMARPSLQNDSLTFPRACRWENSRPHPREWVIAEFEKLRDDQIIWELHPTAVELEAEIIKEILPARKDDSQETSPQSGPNDFLANLPMDPDVKAKIVSNVDTIDRVQRSEMFNASNPWSSLDEVNSLTNTDYLSHQEACNENVESPSTSYDSPRKSLAGTEDDLMLKNRILEEKIVELEKEMGELIKENNQLKCQLLSSPSLEKENDDLKKEVADLRRQNQMLSFSSDHLVAQLEKLLLDEEINGTEET
ncbi:protein MAIN-LIKE 2 isoform X1 [Eucalyptus grandis]|uniref:protein MAIN-LIKE 2 isoform X1 n=1 Tax=Eucalyptus grandis TaxID=71139 RepID=UPI00192EAB4B|nr:protein MAIN-LIKE 2 isoform X1 [Eucalyptus grandis]